MGVTLYDPAVRGRGIGRSALALGSVEEARFRQARVVDGVRYDSVVMGVLRDEWREPPGCQPCLDSRA